jgi:hypothetical protein
MRSAAQFVMDQGNQLFQGPLFTSAPHVKQSSDLMRGIPFHSATFLSKVFELYFFI